MNERQLPKNASVSVIIPCRNEEKYIGKCIEAFMLQTYPKELFEIVICDGMSKDSTLNIVQTYVEKYNNIRVINNEKIITAAGMNKGIKSSNSEIVIIFGAHAFPDKDFIKNNVQVLMENDNVGCVGGPLKTISINRSGEAIALAMSSPFGVGDALFRYCEKETFVDTVAFGAYRKKTIEEIGYFDEEFVRNQDDELNYRLIKKGYKILLSPKIKSVYYSRVSLKKLWKQYFQYGFWKVKVMKKHGKVASIRHIVPLLFVLSNILGIAFCFFSKIVLWLWLFEVGIYLLLDVISTFKIFKKSFKLIKYIFMTFPILHFSYGLGFLEGIFTFYIFKSSKKVKNNMKSSR